MGWLLEHQDQVDLDVTITEEDETTDSDESKSFSQKKVINIQLKNDFFLGVSDSFEDIDASGASEAQIAIGSTSKPFMTDVFKKRSDFLNKDDYALYVRTHVQVGMTGILTNIEFFGIFFS